MIYEKIKAWNKKRRRKKLKSISDAQRENQLLSQHSDK
jgi:hypothetical protein